MSTISPENGNSTCVNCAVSKSSFAMLFASRESTAGLCSVRPSAVLRAVEAEMSATTFPTSNDTPQASNSGPSVEGPGGETGGAVIWFCAMLKMKSEKQNGSASTTSLPPRSTNWSIAKSVSSEKFFGCTTMSVFTSPSISTASASTLRNV